MSEIAVINDNNNFAPSLFPLLWEIIGDCFDAQYLWKLHALPQKNTLAPNTHLQFHKVTSKNFQNGGQLSLSN